MMAVTTGQMYSTRANGRKFGNPTKYPEIDIFVQAGLIEAYLYIKEVEVGKSVRKKTRVAC